MNNHEQILHTYGAISVKTGQMLEAAKRSDWDRLATLEHDCSVLIESLKQADSGIVADADYLQRKAALIRKVLADDAAIRKFTQPWLAQLEVFLGSARQQNRLHRAYGTDFGC